jgi:hypothetical protein
MPRVTLSGAIVPLRSKARSQAGALPVADAKRVASAVAQFQTELAALGFPMTASAAPSVASLEAALAATRQWITASTTMSVNARIWALTRLDRLTAELAGVGLQVGS